MPESEPRQEPGLPPRPDGPPPDDAVAGADGGPHGEVYDWYRRGLELLESRSPAAAVQLLSRAVAAEPHARSLRETLARAQFDAGRYDEAQSSFESIVEVDPADHYAQFGLGLSAARRDDLPVAAQHLAIAAALRPDLAHYVEALRQVRATRRAREEM